LNRPQAGFQGWKTHGTVIAADAHLKRPRVCTNDASDVAVRHPMPDLTLRNSRFRHFNQPAEIPLDVLSVVESPCAHQRHGKPEAQATGVSKPDAQATGRSAGTQSGGLSPQAVDDEKRRYGVHSGRPRTTPHGADATPTVFGAPAKRPPHRVPRRGSSRCAVFSNGQPQHVHHHVITCCERTSP